MAPREIARNKLEAQRLPPLMLEIFDGTAGIPALDYRCQDPYRVFSTQSDVLHDFVPMWECGVVVTGLDQGDGCFVKLSLEEPEKPWTRFSKFSHVVADLFIDLWEDEIDHHTLEELAERFEFEGVDRLLKGLEEGGLNDGRFVEDQTYQKWQHALVTSF